MKKILLLFFATSLLAAPAAFAQATNSCNRDSVENGTDDNIGAEDLGPESEDPSMAPQEATPGDVLLEPLLDPQRRPHCRRHYKPIYYCFGRGHHRTCIWICVRF